jgi:threonine/homoserine/homoserine lactone efflux protein
MVIFTLPASGALLQRRRQGGRKKRRVRTGQTSMDFIPNPLIIPIGLIIGVLVAAPVGPVNVLCIQRAIERGFFGGLAAGIGAVLGDGTIALFAALGVGAISGAIEYHRTAIQIVGGLALAAFGIKLYLTVPPIEAEAHFDPEKTSLRDFVWDIPQTFFLTITNPGAVLGLFAIFGGVSTFVEVHSTIDALLMVAAIMAGSLAWWIFLSNLISRFRHLVDADHLQMINRYAGVALMVFGAVLIGEMVLKGGLGFGH